MRRILIPFAAIAVHVGTSSPWMGEPDRTPRGSYLEIAGQRINHQVLASIQDASRRTGVSFGYLMAQAGRESAFRSDAGSRLSSAAGLYQFTSGTWLMLVKVHGDAYGLAEPAAKIGRSKDGAYTVRDGATRAKILELRRDPRLSALMAGEYAKDNKEFLEGRLGRRINNADLYLAHFLGPYGALRFLKAKAEDARQPATTIVTASAARNNAHIFYDGHRNARSVAAVYETIRGTIERPIERYVHLEEARAWAAAWTENIETTTTRVVQAMPRRKDGATGVPLAAMRGTIRVAMVSEPPPVPTLWEFLATMTPEQPRAAFDAAATEAVQLAATDALASYDRIDQPMPPPGGAAAINVRGPFGWLLAPFRSLMGESA